MKVRIYPTNVRLLAVACAGAMLVACGGGSSSSGTDTSNNVYKNDVGTYASGCVETSTTESESNTLVISDLVGSDQANASFHQITYTGSTKCEAAKVNTDVTLSGPITALTATKTINQTYPFTFNGTVKSAKFTMNKLTLSKGSFTSVPLGGATTNIGYIIKDNKFYAVVGPKESDGLGAYVSKIALTKQ